MGKETHSAHGIRNAHHTFCHHGYASLSSYFSIGLTQAITAGFAYDKLTATASSTKVFVFLYCLANFFQNFGPNTTTFIIPGEVFPTRYRSTGHGISAASGKLGAIIAQVGFARLVNIGGPDKFIKHM